MLHNRQRVYYDNEPLGHIFADKSPTSSLCRTSTGCQRPRLFHYVQPTDDWWSDCQKVVPVGGKWIWWSTGWTNSWWRGKATSCSEKEGFKDVRNLKEFINSKITRCNYQPLFSSGNWPTLLPSLEGTRPGARLLQRSGNFSGGRQILKSKLVE